MAQPQEWDSRGLRSSAVVLFLTGIALVGCVGLAVGVTVRLVDAPRPRVTAALASTSQEGSGRSTPGDTSPAGMLALVGSAASSASAAANAEAAERAAQRAQRAERAQRASRSHPRKPVRHHVRRH